MNTLEDLREYVRKRLQDTLHGMEIDTFKNDVRIPHMLGITDVGDSHDPDVEDGTILDPSHTFWDDWHSDITSRYQAVEKVMAAIETLKEDDILSLTYPYGEEAEILYVEVSDTSSETTVPTECVNCGSSVSATVGATPTRMYLLTLEVSCDECGHSAVYETSMVKR